MQQVRDQVFDKKSRKRVQSVSKACRKPARTCRKPGCKPGQKPGLQLARIMEFGLYEASRGLFATADLLVLAVGLHIHQRTKFLFLHRLISEIWKSKN